MSSGNVAETASFVSEVLKPARFLILRELLAQRLLGLADDHDAVS